MRLLLTQHHRAIAALVVVMQRTHPNPPLPRRITFDSVHQKLGQNFCAQGLQVLSC